jgi:hypothetical protein
MPGPSLPLYHFWERSGSLSSQATKILLKKVLDRITFGDLTSFPDWFIMDSNPGEEPRRI